MITRRLQELGTTFGAVTKLLEENPIGIVLLTHSGKVVFANRAVREKAELADSFLLRQDRMEALRKSDDALLQRLIKGASGQSDVSEPVRGGPMRLPRKAGLRDYAVMVAPLSVASEVTERRGAVACVLITNPEAWELMVGES